MKGISLPIATMVTIVILIILLLVVGGWVTLSSTSQMSQAEANKVFWEKCNSLKPYYNYDDVKGDKDFLKSCQILFGENNNEWSCLRIYCEGNKDPKYAECYWRVQRCLSLKNSNADETVIEQCCDDIEKNCPEYVEGVC